MWPCRRLLLGQIAYYTTPNLRARLRLSSWERGPLARTRAGRPRSQIESYCRVLRLFVLSKKLQPRERRDL